ncbi:Tryptophan--tRNA ligase, mitochondrial [Tilletia horrida]|nr:Tryptophan--tRNA ligase, mitochondrial [Tilletia horrida]
MSARCASRVALAAERLGTRQIVPCSSSGSVRLMSGITAASSASTSKPRPPSSPKRKTILSGIQPTGVPHLGNYLGALCNWVDLQTAAEPDDELFFAIVGFHSITMPQEPKKLFEERRDMLAAILAVGIDPDRCALFQQDQVPEHTELGWILNCYTPFGKLARMTTWKSKLQIARGVGGEAVADESNLLLGLFAYPVLQAADILLYKSTHVPVGDDQVQHLELTRDIADSFNARHKRRVFPPPQQMTTPAKRILSLRDPSAKMSKSAPDPNSRIVLTDTPAQIAAKLKRAVTDAEPTLSYDPETRPAVSNLLLILATLRSRQQQRHQRATSSPITAVTPEQVAEELNAQVASGSGSGSAATLKAAVTEAVIESLAPIQRELVRLQADRGYLIEVERKGRDKARERAARTIEEVRKVIGFEQ